jgi:hypothetical protein
MHWPSSLRLLLVLLLFSLPASTQLGAPLGRCGPHPPDLDWPRNQVPGEQPSSKSPVRPPAVNAVQLQHDARELAELSSSLPADIDRVNHGLLPKDVNEKLRRIEKLSKRLRTELTR